MLRIDSQNVCLPLASQDARFSEHENYNWSESYLTFLAELHPSVEKKRTGEFPHWWRLTPWTSLDQVGPPSTKKRRFSPSNFKKPRRSPGFSPFFFSFLSREALQNWLHFPLKFRFFSQSPRTFSATSGRTLKAAFFFTFFFSCEINSQLARNLRFHRERPWTSKSCLYVTK